MMNIYEEQKQLVTAVLKEGQKTNHLLEELLKVVTATSNASIIMSATSTEQMALIAAGATAQEIREVTNKGYEAVQSALVGGDKKTPEDKFRVGDLEAAINVNFDIDSIEDIVVAMLQCVNGKDILEQCEDEGLTEAEIEELATHATYVIEDVLSENHLPHEFFGQTLYQYMPEFENVRVEYKNRNVVTAKLLNESGEVIKRASAKCHAEDVYIPEVGAAIAVCRLMNVHIPEGLVQETS